METLRIAIHKLNLNLNPKLIEEHAKRYFIQFQQTQGILDKYLKDTTTIRILDVGCGKEYPHTLLFHHSGHHVVGIDADLNRHPKVINKQSVKWFMWSVRKKLLHKYLLQHIHLKKSRGTMKLLGSSVTNLPFKDNTFHAVISVAVWEHIIDVEAAVKEISRILTPSGIMKADAHLYTSISGSHHPLLTHLPLTSIPSRIKPWYHLRSPEVMSYQWINKLRIHEYQDIFDKYFEELEWIKHAGEGQELLTTEILDELSSYSSEELTTRSFQFIGRNRKT